MKSVQLLLFGLSLIAVLGTARARVHDKDIQELINETEREVQKYHLTSMNFEADYCEGPNVPPGVLQQLCKNILQAYLGDHVSSIAGFKAVLYEFAAGKLV